MVYSGSIFWKSLCAWTIMNLRHTPVHYGTALSYTTTPILDSISQKIQIPRTPKPNSTSLLFTPGLACRCLLHSKEKGCDAHVSVALNWNHDKSCRNSRYTTWYDTTQLKEFTNTQNSKLAAQLDAREILFGHIVLKGKLLLACIAFPGLPICMGIAQLETNCDAIHEDVWRLLPSRLVLVWGVLYDPHTFLWHWKIKRDVGQNPKPSRPPFHAFLVHDSWL